MDKLTVRQFVTKFDNGDFDTYSLEAQMDAGWCDWFCKDSALKNKTKALGKKIKAVSKLNFFDIDNLPELKHPLISEWLKDFRKKSSKVIVREIQGVTVKQVLSQIHRHPILVIRFLLTRAGIHINT